MYGVILLLALGGVEEAPAWNHNECHPPPVLDGGGYPGYHNPGGWGRPYGGYGWTGYYCPAYSHLHPPPITIPPEPLFVPPPRRAVDDDEDEEPPPAKDGDKKDGDKKNSDKKDGDKKDGDKKDGDKKAQEKGPGTVKAEKVGLAMVSLNAVLKRDLGVPDEVNGVAVSSSEVSGIAHEAGVRKGTVILSIDGDPVSTAGQAVDALDNGSLREGIRLRVIDKLGKRTTIILKE